MLPISALPPAMPAHSIMPRADIMPSEITNLSGAAPSAPLDESRPPDFANLLGRMVGEVNAKQLAAADAVRGLQAGENVSLHQAVIAMEEASVSFQLMVEVRNKVLESYQEIMRMQV